MLIRNTEAVNYSLSSFIIEKYQTTVVFSFSNMRMCYFSLIYINVDWGSVGFWTDEQKQAIMLGSESLWLMTINVINN